MANQHRNYNTKNPAIKRLLRECNEFQKDPSSQFMAAPLEDNLFEWHFTIRGQKGSDFDGGIYHGRIILPPEYPFKPPNISFLTPNGRFSVGTKICLSISAYHPEEWQPSWSIRTVMIALIGFMPTKGEGAIGALDYCSEDRKALAKQSVDWACSTCGFHSALLAPDNIEDANAVANSEQQVFFSTKPDVNTTTSSDSLNTDTPTTTTSSASTSSTSTSTSASTPSTPNPTLAPTYTSLQPPNQSFTCRPPTQSPVPAAAPRVAIPLQTTNDTLTWFIYAIAALFFGLLLKRFLFSSPSLR